MKQNEKKHLTAENGRPIADNENTQTAGVRGPVTLQDPWLMEKLAHFDREVIPERRMHAKGSGAYGTFTVTHDITTYTRASIFAEVGKKTPCFVRFSTVAGEELSVSVSEAAGEKCPRCWKHSTAADENGLCPRCAAVVSRIPLPIEE